MPTQSYPSRQLGRDGPTVSSIGFGTMGIGAFYGKTDMGEAFKALRYAADVGQTFWDCADIYGSSEKALGQWFKDTGRRSDIFLSTKFGARKRTPEGLPDLSPGSTVCSDPEYIGTAIEGSLARLQTDYIDLYYQHRVDPKVPIEIVLETLRPYVENGTIHWLGLCECSIDTLRRAKKVPGIGEKIVAVEVEFSPFTLDVEKSGFAAEAKELGVTIIAYSPLGRGLASGKFRSPADFEAGDIRTYLPRFSAENFPANLKISDNLAEVANRYRITASQVTLAWILADTDFLPIPGSRSVERVAENADSAYVKLSPEDVKQIRKLVEEADVRGGRNKPEYVESMMNDSLPLDQWKV